MKKILFLLSLPLLGQTLVPSMTPLTLAIGQTGTVSLTFTPGSDPIDGLQWTTTFPPGLIGMWSIGGAGTSANKTLSCTSDQTLCILFGLNETPIGQGIVATLLLTPSVNTKGLNLVIGSGLGADVMAAGVTIMTSNLLINPFSRFDLNQDGLVNLTDLGLAVQQELGNTPCGSADFNADGKCNVIDLLLLVIDSLSPNP